MNERNNATKAGEIELDLQRIFRAVWNGKIVIIVVAVLCAILAFLGTFFLVTPKYQASAMFYVNNTGDSSDGVISSSDLVASKDLVNSYIVILNTKETLNTVIQSAGVDLNYGTLRGMISAGSVDDTEIFRVVITSADPVEAAKVAQAVADVLPGRINEIIDGTSAQVVSVTDVPKSPSSPSYTSSALFGFLIGFVVVAAIYLLRAVFDTTVRTEEDIAQICKYPVLTSVPDMGAVS
jgi:capsular polysaccharide biosynthesis protein